MTLVTPPVPAAPLPAQPVPAQAGARRRLDLAFARLRGLGVLAAGGLPGDPAATRASLSAALQARWPASAGSAVFWTAADDEAAFDADGGLLRPLLLHVSGPAVAAAVRAALAERGLAAVDGPGPLTLLVLPDAG